MNVDLLGGLYDALDALRDDRTCRVIVLTGAGKGFCAGLDLAEGVKLPDLAGHRAARRRGCGCSSTSPNLIPLMRSQPQPIIAAVNGAASGGGLALTLGSDIRIAAASARFNVAFIKVGLSACDIGTSWILPRLIGASRAYELMLTGRFVDSDEALRIGLVTSVAADDALLDAALAEAELILANGPFGVRMTKEVMWSQLEIGSHAGRASTSRTARRCCRASPATWRRRWPRSSRSDRRTSPTEEDTTWEHSTDGARWSPAAGGGSGGRSRSRWPPTVPTSRSTTGATRTSARATVADIEALGRRGAAYAASVDDPDACAAMAATRARRLRPDRPARAQRRHRVARAQRREDRGRRDRAQLPHPRARRVRAVQARSCPAMREARRAATSS